MVLEKQDSGLCLSSTEPSSPTTEAAETARPVAFFVDVSSPTATLADPAAVHELPTTATTTSAGGLPRRDAEGPQGTSGHVSSSRPVSTSRTPSSVPARPQVGSKESKRKSLGQKLHGAFQKLSSSKSSKRDSTSVALSPQDEKILAIMRERKASEDRERQEREKKHREWEEHRVRRSSLGQQRPVTPSGPSCARPQLTATAISYNEASLDASTSDGLSRPPSAVDGTSDYATASRRTSICTSVTSVSDCHSTFDRRKNKHELRAEKRRSVEQRLEQQRREMEDHARQLKQKQEEELKRANSIREARDKQQAMRARMANEKVEQRREQFLKQKQQSLNDLTARHEAINAKLSAAEIKAQKLREEEIQKTKSDLQKRLEQSRLRQKQAEEEMETWRQELVTFNQWQGDNAEKIARQNQAQKSMNACKTRLDKEKKQQDNMRKLMTGEEKRLADMEAAIESKDSRTKALLKEKEEKIMRSRERALATKQLRDDIRAHYSMNDIDQLNRQVALERRLMTRVPNSPQTSLTTSMASLV